LCLNVVLVKKILAQKVHTHTVTRTNGIYSLLFGDQAPCDFRLAFFKGIWQHIFLLFHLEELLKLFVNLRFCVALLFLRYFDRKKSQISEHSAILDFGG
jgi:hypothetical protein